MRNSADFERSRARLPGLASHDASGKELIEFVASYDVGEGKRQMISFWAHSRGDARERVALMRESMTFEGLSADFLPRD